MNENYLPKMFNHDKNDLEKIKYPLVWERMSCGIRVEELQEDKIEDVENLMKKYFVYDNPMFQACDFTSDTDSVDNFIYITRYWMQKKQSLIAIEDGTAKVVGVLIGQTKDINNDSETTDQSSMHEGITMKKIQSFCSHLYNAVNIFEFYDTSSFFRIYSWSVAKEYQGRGIGKALLQACIEKVKLLKIKSVMGIFTGAVSQNIARKTGFQPHLEILYSQWKEDEDLFKVIKSEDFSANIMALEIQIPEVKLEEVKEKKKPRSKSSKR